MSDKPIDGSDMDLAFRHATVFNANPEALERYLHLLCERPILSEKLHHREIIRGITINHIQMKNMIARLDAQNTRTQRWFMVLAIFSLLASILSIAKSK